MEGSSVSASSDSLSVNEVHNLMSGIHHRCMGMKDSGNTGNSSAPKGKNGKGQLVNEGLPNNTHERQERCLAAPDSLFSSIRSGSGFKPFMIDKPTGNCNSRQFLKGLNGFVEEEGSQKRLDLRLRMPNPLTFLTGTIPKSVTPKGAEMRSVSPPGWLFGAARNLKLPITNDLQKRMEKESKRKRQHNDIDSTASELPEHQVGKSLTLWKGN